MMTNTQRQLIATLSELFESEEFDRRIDLACEQNMWFTRDNIEHAVRAICDKLLNLDEVEKWLANYDIPQQESPQKVAVVMAGNIPLVGFFDLFCVLISGCEAVVKPSSKDSVLMTWLAEGLDQKGYRVKVVSDLCEVRGIEMLITMGSDEASRYFAVKFSDMPTLIRSSRHSIAVLSGNETDEELSKLTQDMFMYWGLGCRNVNQLYLPAGYDISKIPHFHTNFQPFNDNYRHAKALLSMRGVEFTDKKGYILIPNATNPPLAAVGYTFYDDIDTLRLPLDRIQCIVSTCYENATIRNIPFGESQNPSLLDYPDSVDIIKFLHITKK